MFSRGRRSRTTPNPTVFFSRSRFILSTRLNTHSSLIRGRNRVPLDFTRKQSLAPSSRGVWWTYGRFLSYQVISSARLEFEDYKRYKSNFLRNDIGQGSAANARSLRASRCQACHPDKNRITGQSCPKFEQEQWAAPLHPPGKLDLNFYKQGKRYTAMSAPSCKNGDQGRLFGRFFFT